MLVLPPTVPIRDHAYYAPICLWQGIDATFQLPPSIAGQIWIVCPDLGLMRHTSESGLFACQHGHLKMWAGKSISHAFWIDWLEQKSDLDLRTYEEMVAQAQVAEAIAEQAIRLVTAPDLSATELELTVGDVRTLMRLAVALYRDARSWLHRNMLPTGAGPAIGYARNAAFLSDVLERKEPSGGYTWDVTATP